MKIVFWFCYLWKTKIANWLKIPVTGGEGKSGSGVTANKMAVVLQWRSSLLLRRFVFCMAEASAIREWVVMNRKGPWEGYRRQAKRRLARCLLPAYLCAHIFIKRETSRYEAGEGVLRVACPRQAVSRSRVERFRSAANCKPGRTADCGLRTTDHGLRTGYI